MNADSHLRQEKLVPVYALMCVSLLTPYGAALAVYGSALACNNTDDISIDPRIGRISGDERVHYWSNPCRETNVFKHLPL